MSPRAVALLTLLAWARGGAWVWVLALVPGRAQALAPGGGRRWQVA